MLLLGLSVAFLWSAPGRAAQGPRFRSEYTVAVADPAAHLFHVTAVFHDVAQPSLDLALPTWTPGWYTIENYAKNVLRLAAYGANGARLRHSMVRKQTWRLDARGQRSVRVEFDYLATVLALNQAKLTPEFGFFTGIELFLEAVGHRNGPIPVHFKVPAGWKIATALDETADSLTYQASDYDALVDAPVMLGHFDATRFEAGGKPHWFVAEPAGSWSAETTARFNALAAKVVDADAALFGGLPYQKYVYFYHFARAESNAGGALEHLNSHVTMAYSPDRTPEQLIGTAAHEYFHTWNVKRIRPAEMWPYDYSRENETPLLWVSEGFTNYYGPMAELRAGIITPDQFLAGYAGAIGEIESNEARKYISPEESSVSTWVGYDSPVAFGISYYPWGQDLGGLLDLSIRHDSYGKASLDDLMRTLFREHYLRGKGYTTADVIAIVNRLTHRDYRRFFDRYVGGTEVPPYDSLLAFAGYRLETEINEVGMLGVSLNATPDGPRITKVVPASPALQAGLKEGDVIRTLDGGPFPADGVRSRGGQTVHLGILRDGTTSTIPVLVGTRKETSYRIVDRPGVTAEQRALREQWLRGA